MGEHATRTNAAWLKGMIDALQGLLKVETDGLRELLKIETTPPGRGSRSKPTFSTSGFQTKPTSVVTDTINLKARFKFNTGARSTCKASVPAPAHPPELEEPAEPDQEANQQADQQADQHPLHARTRRLVLALAALYWWPLLGQGRPITAFLPEPRKER